MKHLCTFALATSLLIPNLRAIDGTGTINVDGLARTYIYHAPGNAVAANLPVVFIFHGDGGGAAQIKSLVKFDQVADEQGFLAVYPEAQPPSGTYGVGIWTKSVDNAPGEAGDLTRKDDKNFISQLVTKLSGDFNINTSKVYATGLSGGAFFCYYLAIRLPDKIKAIAPVAGSMYGDDNFLENYLGSANYIPVRVLDLHGDADPEVPYPDPDNTPEDYGEWPLFYFSQNQGGGLTYTLGADVVPNKVKNLIFSSAQNKVSLLRLIGLGHEWPSNITGFNAERAIWTFFNSNVIGNGSLPTRWPGTTPLATPHWYIFPYGMYFNDTSYPAVWFGPDWTWIYVNPATHTQDGFSFADYSDGSVYYTSTNYFPALYDAQIGGWAYYITGTHNPKKFINLTTNEPYTR